MKTMELLSTNNMRNQTFSKTENGFFKTELVNIFVDSKFYSGPFENFKTTTTRIFKYDSRKFTH